MMGDKPHLLNRWFTSSCSSQHRFAVTDCCAAQDDVEAKLLMGDELRLTELIIRFASLVCFMSTMLGSLCLLCCAG
jgi:hypothetical protein